MKLTDVYNPSSNRRTLIYTQFYTAHNRRTPTLTFKPQSRKSRKTHRHKITRLKNSILPAAEYKKNCQKLDKPVKIPSARFRATQTKPRHCSTPRNRRPQYRYHKIHHLHINCDGLQIYNQSRTTEAPTGLSAIEGTPIRTHRRDGAANRKLCTRESPFTRNCASCRTAGHQAAHPSETK
jgi:hypothetical protein